MFDGKLNSNSFRHCCLEFLVPFIRHQYPDEHRVHMDNAPSHTSRRTRAFFLAHNLNVPDVPAQSPDLNPIELVWHDLKVYIAETVKPDNAMQLIIGIYNFWNTFVTVDYCNRKIDHVKNTVIPKVIEINGKPTGL